MGKKLQKEFEDMAERVFKSVDLVKALQPQIVRYFPCEVGAIKMEQILYIDDLVVVELATFEMDSISTRHQHPLKDNEYLFCLKGEIAVHIDGEPMKILEETECFKIPSLSQHHVSGTKDSEVLAVIIPPDSAFKVI